MKKLCTNCFYIGYEDRTTHGSFKTESILWGIAFVLAFAGVFEIDLWLPALIIFFLAFFYTITLYKIKICVCPRCAHGSMIPLESPKAESIIREHQLVIPRDLRDPARTILGLTFRDALLVLTTILVAVMLYSHFG